ncbi:hypothetical protein CRE_20485 [Caenorhabditis remanei]|uniref:Major sperm protein n=1 Tax=Caenorhabditis remanei TaxID=31234 RepID=E3N2U0_CAERE|nr:hypothetical protein CRE_20485 [Caenorhabditis remanei]
MAQSVPPGDIQTQPNAKIVFNAPYDDKHTYHIKVINSSARRIGYGIKTTNMKRLGVDPPCGVLDPKEAVLLAVSCDAFAFGQEVSYSEIEGIPDPNSLHFRTLTTTVSPSSGPTLQMAQPSSSVVSGSKEMVWFVVRTSRSSTTLESGRTMPNS